MRLFSETIRIKLVQIHYRYASCFSRRIFEFFEGEMPKESYAYMGSDDPAPGMGGFSDVAIRRGFIRKVRIYQGRGFGEIRIRNCLTDPDRGVRRILWGGGGALLSLVESGLELASGT